jgi:hypothetical protein
MDRRVNSQLRLIEVKNRIKAVDRDTRKVKREVRETAHQYTAVLSEWGVSSDFQDDEDDWEELEAEARSVVNTGK